MTLADAYQWTNGGVEVLILRCCDKDGKSYGGFQWPMEVGAIVEAPDWNTRQECGGGLHGWPWGLSIGDGKNAAWDGVWIVFGSDPKEVINLNGKCKAKRGVIRFVGQWENATAFVLSGQIALIDKSASGAASATGWSGAASATGERGAASATGERGAASATGWSGAASATGWSGAASATGERGAASATGASGAASATGESGAASATGWSGSASATGESGAASATGWSGAASATGESGAAICTGLNGKAKAGMYGCIALAWWNLSKSRQEMLVARVGTKKGLKTDTWYTIKDGRFVECK